MADEPTKKEVAMVICTRVGYNDHMPAGSIQRACHGCRHMVWVAPSSVATMTARTDHDWQLWCGHCQTPEAVRGIPITIPPGQAAELMESGHPPDSSARLAALLGCPIETREDDGN